jgi:hypothetical protein
MMSEFPIEMRFLLCVLATWRLCHFFVAEDGPVDVVVKLRTWLGDSFLGLAMDCFYCASVWLAFPFAFVISQDVLSSLVSWLAISGAAALLEQASQRERSPPHPFHQPVERDKK